MDSKNCPRCSAEINVSSNRLITEECGHMKCRKCFLLENDGCSECNRIKNSAAGDTIEGDFLGQPQQLEDEHQIQNDVSLEDVQQKEKFVLLEQMIIPPKNVAEVFREYEEKNPNPSEKQRQLKIFPSHIVEALEEGLTYFKCTFCKTKFRSKNQRYYHIFCNRSRDKPLRCKLCPKTFVTSSHLNYHLKTHNDTNRYNCKECGKTFSREVCLQKHMKKHENDGKYICEQCDKKFSEKFTYKAHMNTHQNIFPFKCDICNKKFSYKSNLKQHESSHANIKNYKCEFCDKTFARKSSFKEHQQRHSRDRTFVCLVCSKTFIDRKTLERHSKTHDGKKYFECPFCTIKSIRKDNLVRHIRNMHSTESFDEALKKIKICLEPIQEIVPVIVSTVQQEEPSETTINDSQEEIESHKIVVTSSVIRSVGNVTPVKVPKDCELNVRQESQNASSKTEQKEATTNNLSSMPTTKQAKKKYDPREIYRKILLDTNDDDDLTLENSELNSDSKDAHIDCCNEPLNKAPHSPSHFTEMHWRKRTSQYFFSAM